MYRNQMFYREHGSKDGHSLIIFYFTESIIPSLSSYQGLSSGYVLRCSGRLSTRGAVGNKLQDGAFGMLKLKVVAVFCFPNSK